MKKLLYGCLGLCGAATLALAAPTLDLTPHTTEGPYGVSRTYFNGAGDKYTIDIGNDARLTGSPVEATVRYTSLREATTVLKLSNLTPQQPFDEETLPAYRATAAAFAPPGVEAPSETAEVGNPLPVNNWKSYRIVNTYRLSGTNIRQSVTFLNLTPEQQLTIVVTAFEDDFDTVARRADSLLHSWRAISNQELSAPGYN